MFDGKSLTLKIKLWNVIITSVIRFNLWPRWHTGMNWIELNYLTSHLNLLNFSIFRYWYSSLGRNYIIKLNGFKINKIFVFNYKLHACIWKRKTRTRTKFTISNALEARSPGSPCDNHNFNKILEHIYLSSFLLSSSLLQLH